MLSEIDIYLYSAIFSFDNGISVQFHDLLDCLTCCNSSEEALCIHLHGIEEGNNLIT